MSRHGDRSARKPGAGSRFRRKLLAYAAIAPLAISLLAAAPAFAAEDGETDATPQQVAVEQAQVDDGQGVADASSDEVAPSAGISPFGVDDFPCDAGYFYGVTNNWGQNNNGNLIRIDPSKNRTIIPATLSTSDGYRYPNALGIGKKPDDGGDQPIYAVLRNDTAGALNGEVIRFDAASSTWINTGARTTGAATNLVGGAVDLRDGSYYFGGFTANNNFRVYRYDPATNTISNWAVIATGIGAGAPDPAADRWNGDFAFNSNGDFILVAASLQNVRVFGVPVALFRTGGADNPTLKASKTAQKTNVGISNINGVAFDSDGYLYLGNGSNVRRYDMPGVDNGTGYTGQLVDSSDLASCSSPPTIEVLKDLPDQRAAAGDQFRLTLSEDGALVADAMTTGSAAGIQPDQIGPLPTMPGKTLTFAEQAAGTTDLSGYVSSYVCTADGVEIPGSTGQGTSGTVTIPVGAQSTVCVFTNRYPSWTLAKTSDPASGSLVQPGSEITYTVTATNERNAPIGDVLVTDDLSAVLSHAQVVGAPTASTGTAHITGTTLTWDVGTLPAATASGPSVQTLVYTVRLDADAVGVTIDNSVSGTGDVPPAACTDAAPCRTTHHTPGAWTLQKTSDPASGSTVLPGSEITYTVRASNATDAAVDGVVVTDDLSDVLNDSVLTAGPTTATGTAGIVGNTLTWDVGTLAANSTAEVVYTVTVNDDALGVTLRNVVTGTGEVPPLDCAPADPCRTEHHTPQWTLAKTSDPVSGSSVAPGSTIAYTLTAKNDSDADVTGVVVSDDLSHVLDHAAVTVEPVASAGSVDRAGNALTWNLGMLAAHSTQTVTYTVKVDADAFGVTIGNAVSGTGAVPPTACTPAEPCETTHHTPGAWTLAKDSDPVSGSTVQPGGSIVYTLTATNPTDAAVAGIVVSDDLSHVLDHAAVTVEPVASAGSVDRAGNALTWNLGTLAAHSSETVTYTVRVDGDALGATLRNAVSGTGDVPPSRCTSEVPCVTEHHVPKWVLEKSSDPVSGSTVPVGSTITYTLHVTNTGPAALVGQHVVDDLSDVLPHAVLVTPLADGLSVDGDVLTWALPEVPVGGSAEISYAVKVSSDAYGVEIRNVATPGDATGSCVAADRCATDHRTGSLVPPQLPDTPQPPAAAQLPNTGAAVPGGVIAAGLGLLTVGGVLLLRRRRRVGS